MTVHIIALRPMWVSWFVSIQFPPVNIIPPLVLQRQHAVWNDTQKWLHNTPNCFILERDCRGKPSLHHSCEISVCKEVRLQQRHICYVTANHGFYPISYEMLTSAGQHQKHKHWKLTSCFLLKGAQIRAGKMICLFMENKQKQFNFKGTNYLQGQTAENIVDMLTVIRKSGSGFGETTKCSPQHLQLRERDLPVSCVLLNQLWGEDKKHVVHQNT